MSPEEQRIKIAEACGWTQIFNANMMIIIGKIWRGYPPKNQIIGKPALIPDYLNDLNAMHEAEKVLPLKVGDRGYMHFLWDVCARESGDGGNTWAIAHATAAQRAEAFLKCLGLWIDDACPQSEVSATANP